MHRALQLPEIVTAVVRAGKTEPGLLFSCLFVNRLFHHEACRILWKGCYGIFGVAHVTPKIRDLASMVVRNDIGRERAQYYANFIRVLVFQQDEITGEDDAEWHPQLGETRFPLLEDLNVWRTNSSESTNTESAILHYLHSGLRDLRVDASGRLTDSFLDEVSRLCPQLEQLDMDFRNVAISQQGLARFLRCMSALQGVHVAALEKSWSLEAFVAVAKYEKLKLLHVPAVNEKWFDALQSGQRSALFPALEYFYCLNTTGKSLRRLHDLNPRIQAIHVYNGNLSGLDCVLPAATHFPRLTNFRYQPGLDTIVQGSDLLQLAQNCPSITSLSIGQDQTLQPTSIDVTDDVIHCLARSLPGLRELYLLCQSSRPPSIASILSAFTEHCPVLERLEISCGADWSSFIDAREAFLLPNLWTIALHPQAHMEATLTEQEIGILIACFREFAEGWFPKVEFFNIDDADEWEQQLNDHMYQVGYKRENGSDIEGLGENFSLSDGD